MPSHLSVINDDADFHTPKGWPLISYQDALTLMGGTLPEDGYHDRFRAWRTKVTETFSVYSHVAYQSTVPPREWKTKAVEESKLYNSA